MTTLPDGSRGTFGTVPLILREKCAVTPGTEDPAVIAYRRWETARKAELSHYQNQPEDEDFDSNPDLVAAEHAETEAMLELARTVPTTPEGLACQLRFAFRVFGFLRPDRMGTEPDDYEPLGDWIDDRADALMRSMLAGAERLAAEAR